jgi:hypothetical protein
MAEYLVKIKHSVEYELTETADTEIDAMVQAQHRLFQSQNPILEFNPIRYAPSDVTARLINVEVP